jgi:hypothetical protein
MKNNQVKGGIRLAIGKSMRFLLIALDLCIFAVIVSQMIYRVLPVNKAVFWVAVVLEIGLTFLSYWYWMRERKTASWNQGKTLAVVFLVVAIAWPILARYSSLDILITAAPSDIIFYWAALSLLIYSSFIVKEPPKAEKRKP